MQKDATRKTMRAQALNLYHSGAGTGKKHGGSWLPRTSNGSSVREHMACQLNSRQNGGHGFPGIRGHASVEQRKEIVGTPSSTVPFSTRTEEKQIRLRELGLRFDSIWALVKKAGGPMKDAIDPIEQKRTFLMEINAYIGRIALWKRANLGIVDAVMSHDHIDDFEKGRSSMIKSMRTSATPLTRKAKRESRKHAQAHPPPIENTRVEFRSVNRR